MVKNIPQLTKSEISRLSEKFNVAGTLAHWTDTERARLFTEAEARAERQRVERQARQDAILRRYDRPSPQSVEYALNGLAVLLWLGVAFMLAGALVAWVAG